MRKVCLLVVAVFLAACMGKKEAPELVVGMDLTYPPFEMINEKGEPAGISVELAKGLSEYLKRPLRIENIPFKGLIPSLQSGRLDCVISSMTDTAERRQSLDFSEPYLSTGLAMLVKKGSPIREVKELDQAGRTVVVRQGTTGEVWARQAIKNATILAVEKENTAVLEVIQGKADAFVYDQMSVWSNWKKNAEVTEALLAPLQREYWAIGVKKGNTELIEQINGFLKSYRAEGGFLRLKKKYLEEQERTFERQGVPFYF